MDKKAKLAAALAQATEKEKAKMDEFAESFLLLLDDTEE